MRLSPGTRIGNYEVVSAIGAGGMGEVYRARDAKLGRDVALKILTGTVAEQPERQARFAREARTLAALNHPGIVTIYAVEEIDGQQLIAMELVEGRPLSELIPKGGLSLERLLNIAAQLAGAVAAAHKHGVVHRDLKPANVMVGPQDRVKVLDFGLAKLRETAVEGAETALGSDITGEGKILGTVAYMSPEQAEGRPVDARSDVFSLGVMLYEMASGERPFKGDTSLSVLSAILRDTPEGACRSESCIAARAGALRPKMPGEGSRTNDISPRPICGTTSRISGNRRCRESCRVRYRPAPRRRPRPVPACRCIAAALIIAAMAGVGWMWSRGAATSSAPPVPETNFSRLTLLEGTAHRIRISRPTASGSSTSAPRAAILTFICRVRRDRRRST